MKIISFSAKRVHGQYNFDFNFREDLNFLVGINGSGKTSALRLMQAAISLDLNTLCAIKFSELHINISRDKMQSLSIVNEGSTLQVYLNGEPADAKIMLTSDEEMLVYQKNGRINDHMEELRLRFLRSAGENLRRYANGERPLFLGLERRLGRHEEENYYERDIFNPRVVPGSRLTRSTIEGLENCKILIESAYRNFRRASDANTNRIVNVVVESTFDFIDYDSFASKGDNLYQDLQGLIFRRNEIENFVASLGGGEKAKNSINRFFAQVSEIFADDNEDNTIKYIKLLLNRAQIQRLQKILEELDKQKKLAEKYYSPIKEITTVVNEFFRHSKKLLEVDSVGRLKISGVGGSINIENLSSGEKQLLILLIHARFSKSRGGIFIVDEPELSLHLRWQEMLVDNLLGMRSSNQFIFATHSPEIIGYKKEYCISLD